MQIVIDIPDEIYSGIVNHFDTFSCEMRKWGVDAIKNGTVLPKEHGRLIDADALKAEIRQWQRDILNPEARRGARLAEAHYQDLINKALTIIEADKEE